MTRSEAQQDRLLRHVRDRLQEAGIRPCERLVVAVSGGVDSVVLLDLLHHLSEDTELRLWLVHLNHGMRPEAAADAAFVGDLGARLGWPVTVESIDVAALARERRLSVEQAGRDCRRDLWRRVQELAGARWVAVGHHADDQAETVLLRLLRGAGTTGLGAMRPVTEDGIVRPLLSIRRSAIEAYAAARGLEVRQDPTNQDLKIPRNRVRHELIPALERRHNPALVTGLTRTARLLQADDDYLEERSREAARRLLKARWGTCVTLDTMLLRGYHMAVQRRVLRQYIQELVPHGPSTFAAVDAVIERLRAGGVGMYQVPGGIWAQNTGTDVILRSGTAAVVHVPVALPGETLVGDGSATLHASFISLPAYEELRPRIGMWRAAFDARVAEGQLQLRSPRPGDRLQPLGMGRHHKKLSDCFIDAKWPRILRPDALLLTRTAHGENDEVLWIAGLLRSGAFCVTRETERILHLEFTNAVAYGPAPSNQPPDGTMS